MRAIVSWLIVVTTIMAWDPWGLGDPFRDGRLRILIYIGAPLLAWICCTRISPVLCLLWTWWVCLWAFMGPDHYGWKEVALPPLFVFAARYVAVMSPGGTRSALRLCYLAQVAIALVQVLGYAPPLLTGSSPSTEPMGTLGHFTLLGAFVAALAPYAFMRWSVIEGILGIVAVICTGSAMAAAALGAAFVVVFWKIIGPRLALATGLLGLSGAGLLWAVLPPNSFFNTSGRSYVWALAWDRIIERPLGWGPGAWEGLYPFWNVPSVTPHVEWTRLHSDWLQLVHEGGWPAGALAALFVAGFLFHSRSALRASVVAAIAVNALGNFPFHFAATAWLFCLAISLPEHHEEA